MHSYKRAIEEDCNSRVVTTPDDEVTLWLFNVIIKLSADKEILYQVSA